MLDFHSRKCSKNTHHTKCNVRYILVLINFVPCFRNARLRKWGRTRWACLAAPWKEAWPVRPLAKRSQRTSFCCLTLHLMIIRMHRNLQDQRIYSKTINTFFKLNWSLMYYQRELVIEILIWCHLLKDNIFWKCIGSMSAFKIIVLSIYRVALLYW